MKRKLNHIKQDPMRILLLVMITALVITTTGCSLSDQIISNSDSGVQAWELITESADRTEVSIVVDESDEEFVTWLEEDFADRLKADYNVTLKVIAQSMTKTFEKLAEEKRLEVQSSIYDLIFLQGDSFLKAKENDYLYGPFTEQVPNFLAYLNSRDVEMIYDEGTPIGGLEVPFARTQLYLIYDENYFYDIPETNEDLVNLMMSFKGQFTYPDPRTSPEGEAFIISMMLPYLDVEKVNTGAYSEAEILEAVTPALETLKRLKSYQYDGGNSFPSSIDALDGLYKNGELVFSMSLENNYATDQLRAYEYPEESNVFVIPGGSTGYTDYVGITKNASNKSAALVVINALLSPEGQAEIYDPKYVGKLPVYDMVETPSEAFSDIKSVKLKSTTLSYSELLETRFSEINPDMRDYFVSLWSTYVLNDFTEE